MVVVMAVAEERGRKRVKVVEERGGVIGGNVEGGETYRRQVKQTRDEGK